MAMPLKDMTGERYGYLTVIELVERNGRKGAAQWLCRCDCGNYTKVLRNNLINRNVKSCGCMKSKTISDKKKTHGLTKTRLHRIWSGAKNRCQNPKNPAYKSYGGRGITFCKEWSDSFMAFYEWANKNGYSNNLSLDRIDNDDGYCPENCRWATPKEQLNNTRNTVRLLYLGETKTLSEWSECVGIDRSVLEHRMRNGWDTERILTEPVNIKKSRRNSNGK